MFSWTVSVLALVAAANGKNLRSNVSQLPSNSVFADTARQNAYNELYSGDVSPDIPKLVNTGSTIANPLMNDDKTMDNVDVAAYCDTLPKIGSTEQDTNANTFCKQLIEISEGEMVSDSFYNQIPGGTLDVQFGIISIAGGTENGKTTIAYYIQTISTTLIQQTKQDGTRCCCCSVGGCSSFIHSGCGDEPVIVNRADTPGELLEAQNYLESTIRSNFAPPSKISEEHNNIDKYINMFAINENFNKTIKKNMIHAGPLQSIVYDSFFIGKESMADVDIFKLKGIKTGYEYNIVEAYANIDMICDSTSKTCEENKNIVHGMANESIYQDNNINHNDVNIFEIIAKNEDTGIIEYNSLLSTKSNTKNLIDVYVLKAELNEINEDNVIPGFKCQSYSYNIKKNNLSSNLIPKSIINVNEVDEELRIKNTDDIYEDYTHSIELARFALFKIYEKK